MSQAADHALLEELGADPGRSALEVTGAGDLPSVFAVTSLAAAAVGAAGLALADLVAARHGTLPRVRVDRRLASMWFATSVRPQGWAVPPAWDALAGDYRAADGWIRLHTNAPAHRAAALAVLDVAADRGAVAQAVACWSGDALEAAIVAQGGCAAALRTAAAWAGHPQGVAVAAEPLVFVSAGQPAPAPASAVRAERPLAGIRVLDLTRVLAGPVATRFLAGFGADVLRIDPPWWDEPALAPDITLGKRCARVDLGTGAGRGQFERLLAGADIIVHGYRPGALEALGFGAARRQAIRPGLVDVSLDAYGWSGPWAGRRGFDSLVQMSAGIAEAGMQRFGRDRPVPLPVQALDHATGYLMAATAIRGLTDRLRGNGGVVARTSLARMAAVLAAHPADPDAPTLAPEQPADYAAAMEATAWGPALRLRPPLLVEDTPMMWERPAGALGSAAAAW